MRIYNAIIIPAIYYGIKNMVCNFIGAPYVASVATISLIGWQIIQVVSYINSTFLSLSQTNSDKEKDQTYLLECVHVWYSNHRISIYNTIVDILQSTMMHFAAHEIVEQT